MFGRTVEGHFAGWDESTGSEGSFNIVCVKFKKGMN